MSRFRHMTAHEVVASYRPDPGDMRSGEGVPAFWGRKYREALAQRPWHESTQRDHVLANGPGMVAVDRKGTVLDGHHGIAVMLHERPDRPFPVAVHESGDDYWKPRLRSMGDGFARVGRKGRAR